MEKWNRISEEPAVSKDLLPPGKKRVRATAWMHLPMARFRSSNA
jgi:hypothetical protein